MGIFQTTRVIQAARAAEKAAIIVEQRRKTPDEFPRPKPRSFTHKLAARTMVGAGIAMLVWEWVRHVIQRIESGHVFPSVLGFSFLFIGASMESFAHAVRVGNAMTDWGTSFIIAITRGKKAVPLGRRSTDGYMLVDDDTPHTDETKIPPQSKPED